MSDRSNAFRVCHSRACLAREESRNGERKLLWYITTTGEGRPARELAQMRDSRARPAAMHAAMTHLGGAVQSGRLCMQSTYPPASALRFSSS
jgi:hypothetical protein